MTQSDAPNEGREEARVDFLTREVLNHLGDGWIKGVIVRQDINNLVTEARSLRDQLSKEREKVERLEQWKKEQIQVWGPVLDYMQDGGSGKRGPIGTSISELVLQILKHHYEGKEREIRKELMGYVKAYRGLASLNDEEDIVIRELISKASELDKNIKDA